MNALTRYALNTAQAKTGLSTGVLLGYAGQGLFAVLTAVLFLVALFFVFSDWLGFGPTKTSVGMFVVFAVLLVGSMIWTASAKNRTKTIAQRALARPREPFPLAPPLLGAIVQLGRKIGWRRMVPAVLVTFAATGVAAEWKQHHRGHDHLR